MNRRIRSVECWVEVNGIVTLRRVVQKDRQFCQAHVTFLNIVLASDCTQIRDFGVFGKRQRDLVDVRQLVAVRIDGPVVRIAFHRPGWRVDGTGRAPRCHHGHFRIERPTVFVLEERDPTIEPSIFRFLGDIVE
jgi:hypothetical protein